MTDKAKKEERLYLLGSSTADMEGKIHYFIKVGCTADLRARMRCYETYNPALLRFNSFPSPSRAYSEAIEDALLLMFVAGRQKSTEWFEVSKNIFDAFKSIENFKALKAFVNVEAFFDLKISAYQTRAFEEEKIANKKRYEARAAHYIALRAEGQ